MADDEKGPKTFGCGHCWPAGADAAWRARGGLAREAELIDEPHFHVMILACSVCGQRFVSVFTETIDWAAGDDAQYWVLLPVTGTEAAELVQRRGSVTEAQLNALGPERRCLQRDHPTAAPARTSWGVGLWVGLHD
jgi:hypothetical protein